MKLPNISLPAVPEELKNVHDLHSAIDAAVVVPEPIVRANLRRALERNPNASVAELIDDLSKRYRKRVSAESGAVGLGAAVPGAGTAVATGLTAAELVTFFAESTIYVLSVTRLYGITVHDVEQRRTLVLSSILGDDADEIMSQKLGLSTLTWARTSLNALRTRNMGRINNWLLKQVIKKTAKKGAASMFGRLIPFGIGAVIGWFSGKHLSSEVIKGLRASLGEPPHDLPPGIYFEDGKPVVKAGKEELVRVESQVIS